MSHPKDTEEADNHPFSNPIPHVPPPWDPPRPVVLTTVRPPATLKLTTTYPWGLKGAKKIKQQDPKNGKLDTAEFYNFTAPRSQTSCFLFSHSHFAAAAVYSHSPPTRPEETLQYIHLCQNLCLTLPTLKITRNERKKATHTIFIYDVSCFILHSTLLIRRHFPSSPLQPPAFYFFLFASFLHCTPIFRHASSIHTQL